MSEITDEVFDAAVKAYCRALPGFPSDAVHRDLTADAVGLRAALAVAFAAGRESVHAEAEAEWDKQEQAAHYLAEEPY